MAIVEPEGRRVHGIHQHLDAAAGQQERVGLQLIQQQRGRVLLRVGAQAVGRGGTAQGQVFNQLVRDGVGLFTGSLRRPAALAGEGSVATLTDWGIDSDRMAQLRAKGIVL